MCLDKSKTLKEVGISTTGTYILIYDFKPISNPLLSTPLAYKFEDNE